MKEIDGITVSALTNGAHLEYMNRVKTLVNADETAKAKAAPYLATFETALAQETSDFAVVTKSLKTDELAAADKARDKYYMAMKQIIESSLESPLTEVATSAQNLNVIIKAHAIAVGAQIDEETAKIDSLVDDLEGSYAADAATVGITAYVTALKEQNELVRTAAAERQEERETKVVGAMKQDRAATDDQYRLMIKLLNARSFIDYAETSASDLETIIVKLNLEIKHYKEQALGQSASASGTSSGGSGSSDSSSDSDGGGSSSSSDSGSSDSGSGSSSGGSSSDSGDI